MLVMEREGMSRDITRLCDRHGRNRTALLSILRSLQESNGWIPDFAMQEIARHLDIHPVEVYSVITFYAFLSAEKKGRFILRLCRTISCDMQGKDRVAHQLEQELGIKFGETTRDGRFSLEWTNCMGMCDQGPALMVNNQIFTHVSPDRVHHVLEACRKAFALYPERNENQALRDAGSVCVEEEVKG